MKKSGPLPLPLSSGILKIPFMLVRQHRQAKPTNGKVLIMPTERPAWREADDFSLTAAS